MAQIGIELKNVTKEFPARSGEVPVKAVDNVSLQINEGEFFALLGPSGCGKTTTLRMISPGLKNRLPARSSFAGRRYRACHPFIVP